MAGTITVGTPSEPSGLALCFPLTCAYNYGYSEYQQVYTDTAFSGPISISGISFYRNTDLATNGAEPADFDVYLSTTSAAVDNLGTNLNTNEGADKQLFGSYSIGTTMPDVLTLDGTPFSYDPSKGNLLVDIVFTSWSNNNVPLAELEYTAPDGLSSRAFPGWSQPYSLYTTFNTTLNDPSGPSDTPEPATIGSLGLGLAGMGLVLRQRRR